MNKRFGQLLSEGIKSVAGRQNQLIKDVEQELADEMGYTYHTVQSWKRGQLPKQDEQIAYLLRYCVRNGRVDRAWANGILSQTQYPNREMFLQELFPVQLSFPKISHIYQNLPPRYGEFLGREADISRVFEGLVSRWPLISIEGMGGVGKTTLALEIGQRCLAAPKNLLPKPFQAVVWVSAKDRPEQKKWLNEVLDTIARVLDYRYIAQLEADLKMTEVDNLLRTQQVLLIIDNFETIEDPDLEQWLRRIPEPSKVLFTTRYRQMRTVWDIHLVGLNDPEALMLIRRHIQRLNLHHLEKNDDKTLLPIIRVTEGNPYAIEMALGYIKRGMLSLEEVIEQMYEASQTVNNIFDYLFTAAWELLNEDSRQLLMASAFFVDSVSKEALTAVTDLPKYRLDIGLGQLCDLSLLNNNNSPTRFNTHPLTRAFANKKITMIPEWKRTSQERWLTWNLNFTKDHETNDWPGFMKLASEHKNILASVSWALHHHHPMAPLFVKQIWYYLYIRGFWQETETFTRQGIEQSKQQPTNTLYYWLLAHLGWLLHEKNKPAEARQYLQLVENSLIALEQLDLLQETKVLNYLGQVFLFEGNYEEATNYMCRFRDMSQNAGKRREVLVAFYYLALIQLKLGAFQEAELLYINLVDEAKAIGYERAEGYCAYRLVEAQLKLGKLHEAENWLNHVFDLAQRWQEPLLQAYTMYGYALLRKQGNELSKALEFAQKAFDIFNRLEASQDIYN